MAEALFNQLGKGRFRAYSAGSMPAGYVHPQAIACLNRNRVPIDQPDSKSWDDFQDIDIDLVITVCDNAANEPCPVFPGSPVNAHWGVPDPAGASGTDAEVADVFQGVFDSLREHIDSFVSACEADWPGSPAELQARIDAAGVPAQPNTRSHAQ